MAGSKETAGAYSGTGETYKRDEMIHGIQIRKTKPVKPRRGRRKAGNGREIRHRCDQTGLYDEIADAMKEGASAAGVKLRWGAAWTINDIGSFPGTAENAMNSYIDTRRSQSRRPFIDAPHFELML